MALIDDEERLRLRAAVKTHDSPFTTFLVSPWSRYVARWAARRGVAPTMVTVLSGVVAVAAAVAAASGTRPGYVVAALLLQVAFVLDCLDGQIARYSRRFSALGAWLDATGDRVKEYAVYAGAAAGAADSGHDLWLLALLALALQTTRHFVDFGFQARLRADQQRHTADVPAADVPTADVPAAEAEVEGRAVSLHVGRFRLGALGRAVISAADRSRPRSLAEWAKRVVVLPVGERWALISITLALGGPGVMFPAVLGWGALATVYMTTGRVLRTVSGA